MTTKEDVSNINTEVSADIILTPGILTASKKFDGHLITLPYVIYILTAHTPIYIPKETIIAYADEE